ncbi:MAG TPA: hypothetical protein VN026_09655 [Bacteroidia bacterium]|jgi:hypothetical protein|nr:hypothetical protein [Bacteroidia bacterium]
MSNTKGEIAIVLGVTLGLAGLGYYFFVYNKGNNNSTNSSQSSFGDLIANLGTAIKPSKDNILVIPFSNNKNFAQFYTNNRLIIFDANKKVVTKGSYSDGGKSIVLDSGQTINSNSVWKNLLDTLLDTHTLKM